MAPRDYHTLTRTPTSHEDAKKGVDMDIKQRFVDADWKQAARLTGLSVTELQHKVAAAVRQPVHGQPAQVKIADAPEENCKDIDFDIKIFTVSGTLCFTPGPDWKLTINLKLFLVGIEVAEVNHTFSASSLSLCFDYDIVIASLRVCFGVRGQRICFFTSGTVCGFGQCTSWDETILCFA